ncbi:MAG: chromatin protein Cren7 [Candidatus Verstraetearchaeota archaeon]|nr:chromatin protein Cren7 [Candidatus Verstraetearchaeota archaeon]
MEEAVLAKCPKCGTEVVKPTKTWKLAPKGKKAIEIRLFKCPSCGAFFRHGQK